MKGIFTTPRILTAGLLAGVLATVAGASRPFEQGAIAREIVPHLYLAGSPFGGDFDESAIYYPGGTGSAGVLGRAIAMLEGWAEQHKGHDTSVL